MTLLTHVVGWTLVHFLWQGALVGLATAAALRWCRRRSSELRYAVACLGLAAMAAAPAVTFATLWRATAADLVVPPAASSRLAPVPSTAAGTAAGSQTARESAPVGVPATHGRWLSLVVSAWLAGVIVLLARFAGGCWRVRRMRLACVPDAISRWQARAEQLATRLRVRLGFKVMESDTVGAPMVIGWLRPVILLPVGAMMSLAPAQVEAILAHELAHIRRHDYAINLVQTLIEAVLFYHPAVWWVSARVRAAREHCCDDVAVALCREPESYAEALAELASWRAQQTAVAVRATDGSLLARIRRLLDGPADDELPSPGSLAALTVGLLIVAGGTAYTSAVLVPPAAGITAATPHASSAQSPALPSDWRLEQTDHFDIYFRREHDLHAARVAEDAERAYERISADLRHSLAFRVPVVLVPSSVDPEQQARQLWLQVAGAGTASADTRDRVLFAVDRPAAQWYGLLVHEVAHVFTFDILPGSSAPTWVVEGLAEYERGMWEPASLSVLRDAVRANAVPRLSDLSTAREGQDRRLSDAVAQAAFEFIESRWGEDGIRELLLALRRSARTGADPLEASIKLTAAQFEDAFGLHLRERFDRPAEPVPAAGTAAAAVRIEGDITAVTPGRPGLACVSLRVVGDGERPRRWAIECEAVEPRVLSALRPGDRIIVTGRPAHKWGTERVAMDSLSRPADGLTWERPR